MNKKIKSLMILNDVKQPELAQKLNCSQPAISRVIHGKSTSARIRLAIAQALDKTVEQLWPETKKAA